MGYRCRQAATELKGDVFFGAVDCDMHKDLAGKYGVKGFPTLKGFVPGTAACQLTSSVERTLSDLWVAAARASHRPRRFAHSPSPPPPFRL